MLDASGSSDTTLRNENEVGGRGRVVHDTPGKSNGMVVSQVLPTRRSQRGSDGSGGWEGVGGGMTTNIFTLKCTTARLIIDKTF